MQEFAFVFGYQSPEDVLSGDDCEKVGFFRVLAESEDVALSWGKELAGAYVRQLFSGQADWNAQNFAAWIEHNPDEELVAALAESEAVTVGTSADFHQTRTLFRD